MCWFQFGSPTQTPFPGGNSGVLDALRMWLPTLGIYQGRGDFGVRGHQTCFKTEVIGTLPKTNMEPQSGHLEDELPFPMGDFQVPC